MKYFHGGIKNLKIGDFVLPPSVTGKTSLRANVGTDDLKAGHCLLNRVYITTDLNAAKTYASVVPFGDVYQVEPVGRIEADIDAPEISFICEKAKIVSIIQRRTKFKFSRVERMMQ